MRTTNISSSRPVDVDTVTGTATDSQSGPRSVTIKLDEKAKASRTDCLATPATCSLDWTLNAADPNLTEGTHTITVEAPGHVGNSHAVATRTFRIERTKPSLIALWTRCPFSGQDTR